MYIWYYKEKDEIDHVEFALFSTPEKALNYMLHSIEYNMENDGYDKLDIADALKRAQRKYAENPDFFSYTTSEYYYQVSREKVDGAL